MLVAMGVTGMKTGSQVDMYVDTTVPHPDVKVYVALCLGGGVRYDQVIGLGMDDCWVLRNVARNSSRYHFCKTAAVVFGKAIFEHALTLWPLIMYPKTV